MRLHAQTGMIENGFVYIPETAPWLAEYFKGKGQPVAHVIVDRIGDEHPAGIGQSLDPRRDVDAVAIDVLALDDHVAEMPMRSSMRVSAPTPVSRSATACCISTAQRTASTTLGKLHQHAVAGRLDDPAVVLGDFRIDELAAPAL